jgi:hypothetical protein
MESRRVQIKARVGSFLLISTITVCVLAGAPFQTITTSRSKPAAELKALEFLLREVPAWSKENGCFSCHNNGDAARALYVASRKGYRVPASALADTTAWVAAPNQWEQNKGDPGFSDKRLANVQFAAALLSAFETGHLNERQPLAQAARKLAADQQTDGAWQIDAGNTPGSPATYGTPLATWLALRTLKKANLAETKEAIQKAERWLAQTAPKNVLTASTLLLAFAAGAEEPARRKQAECLKLLSAAQSRDGGWGPYADAPPEVFDTALALLALAPLRQQMGVADLLRRGRGFLIAQQLPNGSWPATTRPSGGDSYAQMMSTTGWAMLALLETNQL